MITIALPKGKLLDTSIELFAKIGIESLEDMNKSRKLIFDTNCDGFRFMIIRAADVPTYVEYGAADLGIVGRDVLLEQEYDVYEPLDLKFGYCRLMVAEPKELSVGDDIRNWCNVR
ncbi:MAG: ATP phosphoribosyltransferase, partial [Nitrospirota bacterium]|nr:ATP phosphoribosyltransferase [Nitrospirota bacterium]